MKKLISFTIAILCTFSATAQSTIDSSERALAVISAFANAMCADPEYRGYTSSASAGAKAKADISSLIKKLVDVNIDISTNVKHEAFQGLLQKDLLEATKTAANCKFLIYNDLKDRLLPKVAPSRISTIRSPQTKSATPASSEKISKTTKLYTQEIPTTIDRNLSYNVLPKAIDKPMAEPKNVPEAIFLEDVRSKGPSKLAGTEPHEAEIVPMTAHNTPQSERETRIAVSSAVSALMDQTLSSRVQSVEALLDKLPVDLNAREIELLLAHETLSYRKELLVLLVRRTKTGSLDSEDIPSILGKETLSHRVDCIRVIAPYIRSPITGSQAAAILASESSSYRVSALSLIASKIHKPISKSDTENLLRGTSMSYRTEAIKILFN